MTGCGGRLRPWKGPAGPLGVARPRDSIRTFAIFCVGQLQACCAFSGRWASRSLLSRQACTFAIFCVGEQFPYRSCCLVQLLFIVHENDRTRIMSIVHENDRTRINQKHNHSDSPTGVAA
jgi:hypothetical protein